MGKSPIQMDHDSHEEDDNGNEHGKMGTHRQYVVPCNGGKNSIEKRENQLRPTNRKFERR
jgi:hypothetical protein